MPMLINKLSNDFWHMEKWDQKYVQKVFLLNRLFLLPMAYTYRKEKDAQRKNRPQEKTDNLAKWKTLEILYRLGM